jgi:transposase
MDQKKRYSRFVGIDIAKNRHVFCVLDRDGQTIQKPRSLTNDEQGYQQLRETLKSIGQTRTFLVGMEATAHYWYSLHDDLTRQGYHVVVLNPIQTAQQAKKAIRKCKTDKVDAMHIATLIKNGDYKPALVPGPLAMTCRQLTRLRMRLIQQNAMLKQWIWSRLHPIWPEYETLFSNPFCATGRKLLFTAPSPADVLAMDPHELSELFRKASRGKYGQVQAQKAWQAAAHSVGMQRGLDGARIGIRTLLSQLEATQPIHEQLKQEIVQLAQRLPEYLFTLPGIDPIRAVSLFGETDPITDFKTPGQLVAFSGLDLTVFQTGQYEAPRRRISKRGSPFLRYTLWHMAYQAVYQEGDLRAYWLRKLSDGLTHKAAVTAAAIKLCRITWRILTDKRDYLIQGRPSQS